MSTYINPAHPARHAPYLDIPDAVVEYLHYLEFVKRRSPRTINGYYIDLRGFFRHMLRAWEPALCERADAEIDTRTVTGAQIAGITKRDIYAYLDHVHGEAGNGTAAMQRKISALRGFFKYLHLEAMQISYDPTENIVLGRREKKLPKYLSLEEAQELLKNTRSDFSERDYCILAFFLNCGMRLSELCSMNLTDFKDDTVRIVGKGSKERLVYLNEACQEALGRYLPVRASLPNLQDRNALFVSKKTGKRLSARRVEQMVAERLQAAGLAGKGYTPHKLRHTAATLMYQSGKVDMLQLKEILGHENVSTTQIYTHLNRKQLHDAVNANPLAQFSMPEPGEDEKDL